MQNGVDYPELSAVAPRTAWLWYYPFVVIMIFVVINSENFPSILTVQQ